MRGAVSGIRRTTNLCHDVPRMGLRKRDLEGLLAFVSDARDAEVLTTELMDRLAELFGCAYATYEAFDRPRQAITAYVPCSNEAPMDEDELLASKTEQFWSGECNPRIWTVPFDIQSDRLERPERERIRDETEYNAEFRIVDSIHLRFGDFRTRSAVVHFETQDRDFDARERDLALALRPHLRALWRSAVSRSQVAELIAALEGDADAGGAAIVVRTADGRIEHATSEARRLLGAWFATRNGRLPPELDEWVALAGPGDRYSQPRN